jgi:hypothetical protein
VNYEEKIPLNLKQSDTVKPEELFDKRKQTTFATKDEMQKEDL